MDRVVLLDRQGRKRLLELDAETLSVPGLGVLKADNVRSALGGVLAIGGESFYVLRPSARDLAETLERKAQIITAKDVALLLFYADVKPGDTVVEAGSGSGGLTVALARAVGGGGRGGPRDVREAFLAGGP